MSSEQPPNYTVDDRRAESSVSVPPQIMITPLANAVGFQSGNLGADGEPAAVEGEVQLKGFTADAWDRVLITLRTTETTPSQTVELASSDLILWSRKQATTGTQALPSNLPFSIPLMPDVPQSIITPTSSLTHVLTVTLLPGNPSTEAIRKAIPIQVRRFTHPWAPILHPSPSLLSIDTPVPFTVQLPRSAFRAGEMIPLYLSVPPPNRAVLESGMQLRNVTAELVRLVEIGPFHENPPSPSDLASGSSTGFGVSYRGAGPSSSTPRQEKAPDTIPQFIPLTSPTKPTSENVHETVVTRSGASCRMNPNRTVQLRLVLHSSTQSDLDMENEAVPPDVDTAPGSITQSTVLHRVSFYVQIHVTFLSQVNHTSKSVHGLMPVVIIPALAQQQVDAQAELDENYAKKHDRPPPKTVRSVDDTGTPQPPAFEDESGDGLRTPGIEGNPPPFTAEPLGTGELPSFTESQAAASGSRTQSHSTPPPATTFSMAQPEFHLDESGELRFDGEGVAFGFQPEDQYDGLSHSMMMPARGNTPPPAISSSVHDANVTELAELITHERRSLSGDGPGGPPPPPALDDPMDLPPTIDEGFRTMDSPSYAPVPPQLNQGLAVSVAQTPVAPPLSADGRPPPYLGAPGAVSTAPPSYLDSRRGSTLDR
ncbi:hypothetical protein FRB96_005291 [Tulasnella sp. 330]|nr:hypothetical protein FRB96_005291 [Tulasnella sp. 330]